MKFMSFNRQITWSDSKKGKQKLFMSKICLKNDFGNLKLNASTTTLVYNEELIFQKPFYKRGPTKCTSEFLLIGNVIQAHMRDFGVRGDRVRELHYNC